MPFLFGHGNNLLSWLKEKAELILQTRQAMLLFPVKTKGVMKES